MIELEDVRVAEKRIAGLVRRTPVMTATALQQPISEAKVSLKLELLQATGSFKARGATNKLRATSSEQLAKGIVTASGGNHGLATARAGKIAGVPTTIFLPENVSPPKLAKLKKWGAEIRIVGKVWDESNVAALKFAEETGAAYFHPFADPLIAAGQGTLGLEILDDLPDVDTILVAIGGGGLISGLSVAVKALKPNVRIIGIEPVGAPTLHDSLKAGKVVTLEKVTTRVPTMAAARTDEKVFEIVRKNVEQIVLLTDDEMMEAARWLWFELGIAADLSGAASIAALMSGKFKPAPDSHVCALICGAGPDGISD
jgi:threonine dehydratase